MSFALIPVLNLPRDGRGPVILVLPVLLFLMIGGVGLIAQAKPALRDAAVVVNGLFVLFALPEIILFLLGLSTGPSPDRYTASRLALGWFAIAWGGSSGFNVIALTQIKLYDARGKGEKPCPARDWGAE